MDIVKILLQGLLVLSSLFLVLLILMHKGSGGGLSDMFGGGMGAAAQGSTVVEKNLDRITLFTAVIWLIAILGIGLEIKYS